MDSKKERASHTRKILSEERKLSMEESAFDPANENETASEADEEPEQDWDGLYDLAMDLAREGYTRECRISG